MVILAFVAKVQRRSAPSSTWGRGDGRGGSWNLVWGGRRRGGNHRWRRGSVMWNSQRILSCLWDPWTNYSLIRLWPHMSPIRVLLPTKVSVRSRRLWLVQRLWIQPASWIISLQQHVHLVIQKRLDISDANIYIILHLVTYDIGSRLWNAPEMS